MMGINFLYIFAYNKYYAELKIVGIVMEYVNKDDGDKPL